jgi:hypothetical protein
MGVVLCDDGELGYRANRTRFADGQPLLLDEHYRLAHLPLVAPDHPGVIAHLEGKAYDRGRHPPVTSLVLPVPADALEQALVSSGLHDAVRHGPFAHKIAWHVLPQRRERLHATICGALASGPTLPVIGAAERQALAGIGGLTGELRGLFSGNVNVGRLYLRVYPEKRGGLNVFHRIQDILGVRRTDLYVVGLYNLMDDLDAAEAAALADLRDSWWDRPLLRLRVDALWLLRAFDDLVLDGGVLETIALC